jgi:hypothetical protein
MLPPISTNSERQLEPRTTLKKLGKYPYFIVTKKT